MSLVLPSELSSNEAKGFFTVNTAVIFLFQNAWVLSVIIGWLGKETQASVAEFSEVLWNLLCLTVILTLSFA